MFHDLSKKLLFIKKREADMAVIWLFEKHLLHNLRSIHDTVNATVTAFIESLNVIHSPHSKGFHFEYKHDYELCNPTKLLTLLNAKKNQMTLYYITCRYETRYKKYMLQIWNKIRLASKITKNEIWRISDYILWMLYMSNLSRILQLYSFFKRVSVFIQNFLLYYAVFTKDLQSFRFCFLIITYSQFYTDTTRWSIALWLPCFEECIQKYVIILYEQANKSSEIHLALIFIFLFKTFLLLSICSKMTVTMTLEFLDFVSSPCGLPLQMLSIRTVYKTVYFTWFLTQLTQSRHLHR